MSFRIIVEEHETDEKGDSQVEIVYQQSVDEIDLQEVIKAVNNHGHEQEGVESSEL